MYAIQKTRYFFGPRTEKSYVTHDSSTDRRAEFRCRADAQAVADQMDAAIYYVAHNESGRAQYRVVRIRSSR